MAKNHESGCPRGKMLDILKDKRAEGEGSQCAGLDEEDYPCTCLAAQRRKP